MFVESEFLWKITVEPHQFENVDEALIRNLLRRFDNTRCTEAHGYCVAVTWIESVDKGTIREGKGYVTYPVSFRGLTFKPLLGEIVLGTVFLVTEMGVLANLGPGEFAVSNHSMGKYEYSKEKRLWKHTDGMLQIKQGSSIRAKIVKMQWFEHLSNFKTSCSLEEDFLGIVQVPFTKQPGETRHAETSSEVGA